MDWDAIVIFNEFGGEGKLNKVLIELVDRGMLLRDKKSNKFDLHPLVRKYCYERLRHKEGVHAELRDYFAVIPEPEKIESLDELSSVIELYHHTVKAGMYDEARVLLQDRLANQLYYRFGAYQIIIELLRALFIYGEDKLPKLKTENAHGWTLIALANSYALSGQPIRAVLMSKMGIEIAEKQGNKENVARGLANLADMAQIEIGEFDAAEFNLRRSIEINREMKDEYLEAVIHGILGRMLIYRGKFKDSENEHAKSIKYMRENNEKQGICMFEANCSVRALS
jgi:tetratricopeptide (TPR) repeat protein